MPELFIGTSPHIGTSIRTRGIMLHMLIALAPVSVFGIILYGIPALLVIVVCVAAAVLAEAAFRALTRQENRAGDLSAALSGLLLALVLPPGIPLWMAALGAVFAVVVAKEFFGGLGANVFNPALSGRAFLLMSFPAAVTTWSWPRGIAHSVDALSAATPLGIVKLGGTTGDVAQSLGAADYPALLKTLFIGTRSGCIGESSILLILAGCVYLLALKVIDWRAPLAMTLSAVALSGLLGMDPLFSVLTGGLLFGAVFMATDYTTAPLTAAGKILFGAGAGIITILIRKWGNYPEGTSYGILIMNAATPFLNHLIQKKYGFVPKKAAK